MGLPQYIPHERKASKQTGRAEQQTRVQLLLLLQLLAAKLSCIWRLLSFAKLFLLQLLPLWLLQLLPLVAVAPVAAARVETGGFASAFRWHLGQRTEYLPTSRGFDEYLGTSPRLR